MWGSFHRNKTRSQALTASVAHPDDMYFCTDVPVVVMGGVEYGDMSLDVTALFTQGGTVHGVTLERMAKSVLRVQPASGIYSTAGLMTIQSSDEFIVYTDMLSSDSIVRRMARCSYNSGNKTVTSLSVSGRSI